MRRGPHLQVSFDLKIPGTQQIGRNILLMFVFLYPCLELG
jgi:hypothetical protein